MVKPKSEKDLLKLSFHIEYCTQWGEQVGVMIEGEQVPVMLTSTDGKYWAGIIEVKAIPATYRYGIFRDGEAVRIESGRMPHALPKWKVRDAEYIISDSWRDQPVASYLFSSAFSGDYPITAKSHATSPANSITLRVMSPCIHHKSQQLAIVGECVGGWDIANAIAMEQIQPNVWSVTLDTKKIQCGEYKFVALNTVTNTIDEWENGSNRYLIIPHMNKGEHVVMAEQELYFPSAASKVAGTAIPVFSLRSEGSQGVGDFGDIIKMVDWAVKTGQRAVQILPINDTTITGTWVDSYPYNSISIYAFHPMYIDLRQLPELENKEAMEGYEATRKELNAKSQVDYEAVNSLKRDYLHQIFAQSGKEILASTAFKKFFKENAHWLQPYAAFSYLRDKFGTPVFSEWPEHNTYNAEAIARMCNPRTKSYAEISFYYYIQYQLHIQLLAAGKYARSKGVILKGDIPIGISRNSVEAWVEPYYFNMNGQAGAPPDAFSASGQNWGFPTYNWDVMAADGYQWWRRRFTKMAEYFSAYRIDHILGFFRIWEIPAHSVNGLIGQFSPAMPMSIDEIQSYGLHFQKEFMTRPFINKQMLNKYFGDKAEYVKTTFLQHSHDDIYAMKPELDTQRKVEAYLSQHPLNEGDEWIRDGVYSLIDNVLFVPDRKCDNMYHPRISAQNDYLYSRLNEQEKAAFDRLYVHYFYERHNQFWYDEAMKKLPQLTQATSMLVCGEDLGMVPDCVPWVMDKMQILSLEIQRMPKNPQHEFGHVEDYPHRSVCTISTHDMSTLRGWWHEDEQVISDFYHKVLGYNDATPAKASGSICEQVVRQHLASPSLLCILALQDWFSIDESLRVEDADSERINVPANPRHYWRYRMHVTLEELMANDSFNNKIAQMIYQSHRV